MVPLSVIIVTKNRAQLLKQCLGSLAGQTEIFTELIIVNNQSNDETPELVKNFQKNTKIPTQLISERGQTFPVIYNRGLTEASQEWVAFIDDDCLAEPNWMEAISLAIKSHPESAAFLGNSKTYFSDNPYSLATWLLDEWWKVAGRKGSFIHHGAILDNKNVVYNRKFLEKNHLKYDETRTVHHGAAEDADLGLQIQEADGRLRYLSKMIVYHQDPRTWSHFWQKFFNSNRAFKTLFKKWGKKLEQLEGQELSFTDQYKQYYQQLDLPLAAKLYTGWLVYTAGFISRHFLSHEKN